MNLKNKYSNREKNRRNDTNVVLVCKECNGIFTTTVGELCWHYDIGNLIPVYCDKCRTQKKEKRAEKRKQRQINKAEKENSTIIVDGVANSIEETQEEKLIEEN